MFDCCSIHLFVLFTLLHYDYFTFCRLPPALAAPYSFWNKVSLHYDLLLTTRILHLGPLSTTNYCFHHKELFRSGPRLYHFVILYFIGSQKRLRFVSLQLKPATKKLTMSSGGQRQQEDKFKSFLAISCQLWIEVEEFNLFRKPNSHICHRKCGSSSLASGPNIETLSIKYFSLNYRGSPRILFMSWELQMSPQLPLGTTPVKLLKGSGVLPSSSTCARHQGLPNKNHSFGSSS